MNRLFGSKNAAPKPGLTEAIASTEQRADGVTQKIKKLDQELTRYREQMKKMGSGPGKKAVEQRALRVLRQKRLYEGQLDQLYQQSYNMEQATMTTENLRNTMATVDAMNSANKEMRKTYGKIDLDKIERVQDDMEDMIEQANEVQETLGRTYGVPDEIDEEELQAELDALGDDLGAEETSEVPSYLTDGPSALPDVVNDPIKAPAEQESVSAVLARNSRALLLTRITPTGTARSCNLISPGPIFQASPDCPCICIGRSSIALHAHVNLMSILLQMYSISPSFFTARRGQGSVWCRPDRGSSRGP